MKMVVERTNIEFPMWRKKVDGSLFMHSMTTIPIWVHSKLWKLSDTFHTGSKNDAENEVVIELNHDKKRTEFKGWVTRSDSIHNGKPKITMRLIFEKGLKVRLQQIYVMSHMRDLELRMRHPKPSQSDRKEIEEEIPFYEFLDIEWDESNKRFLFRAHYIQRPVFTKLFTHLQNKHVLDRIEDEIDGIIEGRITKGDWKERSEISKEIATENVIYTLIDTENREIYVGEASNLANRFKQKRHEIPGWTHYRVDQLPEEFNDKMRRNIERLMIRYLASLLENLVGIESMEISDYLLKNKRVDK